MLTIAHCQWPIHKQFLMPVLLIVLSLGTCSMALAQSSWYGLRDEPRLVSVRGTLADANTIVVRAVIDGKDTTLRGHTARAFLYLRSYLIFDDDANRWRTTDKYKAWKNQLANNPQPAPLPLISGSGISYVPGSGSPPSGCKTTPTCRSTTGQNKICQKNQCVTPKTWRNAFCYWSCRDYNGKVVKIRSSNGQRF